MILNGKTVIVTGVGGGLGRECAASALRDGANVVLAARTADDAGDDRRRARPERRAGGHPRHRHHRRRVVRRPWSATPSDRFGSVDALIQVAAFENVWGGLYDLRFEAWRKAFETNVLGALTVLRPVADGHEGRAAGARWC